jgi:hypothetical protein
VTNDAEQPRRPVGVAPESSGGRLVVVCDDGSVWKWHDQGSRWEEMTPIPGSSRASTGTGRPPGGS